MQRVVLAVLVALTLAVSAGGPALAGGIKTGNEIGFKTGRQHAATPRGEPAPAGHPKSGIQIER
jgi:hypothetical protein